jgi:hypothetical protein
MDMRSTATVEISTALQVRGETPQSHRDRIKAALGRASWTNEWFVVHADEGWLITEPLIALTPVVAKEETTTRTFPYSPTGRSALGLAVGQE